ncbi:UDP-glycosyltransferase 76B1-like isoform X2 [Solanum stenotomum]|uniref:UDP-glycosyltransferase 76B1-like isoform X2 n=1 Tax=Solanum stenotomum TaxID=172797 RepID=UPI0020CFF467|nr:UDP-glycosyltransferase 76B1-like isoform X2 [Solanum stenotomum]
MEEQGRKGKRVLFFPLPLQGHITPMLQLANILHLNGFSITIILADNFNTTFNNIRANYPHFTFHTISDGLSEDDKAKTDTDALFLLSLFNEKCAPQFTEALRQLVLEDPNIVCLISDSILHFTKAVVDSFKLPRLVLRTGGVCSLLVFAAIPLLQSKAYFPLQGIESQLEEAVEELPPLRIKDLPLFKTYNVDALYQVIQEMIRETKASSGLILNSFEQLEQFSMSKLRDDFPIPIFPIGPFHSHFPASSSSLMSQDQTSISWLDTKPPKSVIYVSFGSVAAIEINDFLEIAWGLANSNHPFLWVVRPGLIRGSEWIELLPSEFLETVDGRGHIIKWAPQQQVLAHPAVGAFWTHNGWNSTLESICEGVPMICMPCFGDQMVNARYVSHVWKVGVQLENDLKRMNIENAIRRLMEEEEGKQIKERMLELKEKENSCLKPGGSSYESLRSLTSYISSF